MTFSYIQIDYEEWLLSFWEKNILLLMFFSWQLAGLLFVVMRTHQILDGNLLGKFKNEFCDHYFHEQKAGK